MCSSGGLAHIKSQFVILTTVFRKDFAATEVFGQERKNNVRKLESFKKNLTQPTFVYNEGTKLYRY